MSKPLTFGTFCSGIGAPEAAWSRLGWQPKFFSEIEPFPCAVLAHHYPDVPNLGDMERVDGEALRGSVDVVCAGTPCQSFSVAGLRKGMADPRGNLALVLLRLLDQIRPRWVVWENVDGVRSSGQGRDFGAFLGGLGQLGYGWAYRVLDAQFGGVPQRRRRVFVVGHLGDWRRAAAVLFGRESLCGHPPPSREAGARVAASLTSSLGRRCGVPDVGDTEGQLIAHTLRAEGFDASEDGTGQGIPLVPAAVYGGGDCSGAREVAACLAANGQRLDYDVENFVLAPVAIQQDNQNGVTVRDTAGSPRADAPGHQPCGTLVGVPVGFSYIDDGRDAGEDIVPTLRVGTSLKQNGGGNIGGNAAVAYPIPFDTTQITSAQNYSNPQPGDACHPLAAGAHPPAVAYGIHSDCFDRSGEGKNGTAAERAGLAISADLSPCLNAKRPNAVATPTMAVRRLTPLEAERLMGFEDGYTAIPFKGKPAADGPRYRALGNSMVVPELQWIGRRIQAVEAVEGGGHV